MAIYNSPFLYCCWKINLVFYLAQLRRNANKRWSDIYNFTKISTLPTLEGPSGLWERQRPFYLSWKCAYFMRKCMNLNLCVSVKYELGSTIYKFLFVFYSYLRYPENSWECASLDTYTFFYNFSSIAWIWKKDARIRELKVDLLIPNTDKQLQNRTTNS